MKRLFTFMLFILTAAFCFMAVMQPESGWARRLSYYLSQVSSTTTKTFTLDGDAAVDTTAVFTLAKNMMFFAHAVQANDSVFMKAVLRVLPRNYADSTTTWADVDSAWVTAPGVQVLKWSNFRAGTDSLVPEVPPAYYGQIFFTTTADNGFETALNIRYEGATEGDF